MKDSATHLLCEDIIVLFGRVKFALTKAAEEQKLTMIQLGTLYFLSQRHHAQMSEVAKAFHCDPSNVTGVVDRLAAQGLIERHEDKDDRRARSVNITPAGKRIIESVLSELPEIFGCNKITPPEKLAMHGLMQKMF